jgi:ABC-type lipoprotein export system ATPase subunit
MTIYITKVKAIGVHNQFDFDEDLHEGMNIFYGLNGTGKTTFLQIIANILNSDFERFKHIIFKYIEVTYTNGDVLKLDYHTQKNIFRISKNSLRAIHEIDKDFSNRVFGNPQIAYIDGLEPLVKSLYIPAFRLIVDAWFYSSQNNLRNDDERINEKTLYARQVFGEFAPVIDYPSVTEVLDKLTEDLKQARLKLANSERDLFLRYLSSFYIPSLNQSNKNIVADQSVELRYEDIKKIVSELQSNQFQNETESLNQFVTQIDSLFLQDNNSTEQNHKNRNVILDTYHKFFSDLLKIQKEYYENLDSYLNAVNNFLIDKKLVFEKENDDSIEPTFCFKYINDSYNSDQNRLLLDGVQSLSSGERQIVSFIYACYFTKNKVVLIDEPETSLHIDWQRELLDSISQYSHQFIICTHSPSVPADYSDYLKKLNVRQTDKSVWDDNYIDTIENDENLNHNNESEDMEDIEVAI